MRIIILLIILSIFSGCTTVTTLTVRQQDLDAWVNQPVYLLDTHQFFSTIKLERTFYNNNIEVRNYNNTRENLSCRQTTTYNDYLKSSRSTNNCQTYISGCKNIFIIQNNIVQEYRPVGNCYTDETTNPYYKR